LSKSFDDQMPSPEKIWQHMESYATQEMSITGKGIYMVHQPMELPSSTINGYFNPNKGHKNPKLLIEYAFRHRPMEQVIKLIEIHDPKHEIIKTLSENAKKRILFHIVPNRVSWSNFNQYVVDKCFFEKWLEDTDSLQKLLFCHEHNLLPKFIDKNTADKFLISCCAEGNAKVAKLVLDMPEFPMSNFGIKSAFLKSIHSKNIELTKVLFDRVTDFHIKNNTSDTVFHFASSHPTTEILELLLGPKSLRKYYGSSSAECIEERVFLLNEKNDSNVRPLELAIKKNNTETVKLLLKAGANPHILNSKGKHFLHQAVFRGNPAVVKLLLAREAEIGAINVDMSPILLRAILKSEKEIALMLIEHCAMTRKKSELNTQYDSGMTPLLLAVKKRDSQLIMALLAAGADPTATSKSGQNVLHKISKEHLTSPEDSPSKISASKTSSEKNLNKELNFSQTEDIVKSLIKYGAAVNGRDNTGNTPAIIAAQAKNDRLVKLLLLQGADINAKNNEGRTLLHFALENQDRDLSNHLLENGINLDAESFNLDSALVLGTKSNDNLACKHIIAAIDRKKLNNV
jgi:ankyrin repeat protein